ncbi:MAG: methionyl-tRNA formyltransferase, partial [Parcubacteria group bacterium]
SPVSIEKRETAGNLHDKLAVLGARSLEKHVVPYIEGRLPLIEQDHEQATYCKKIRNVDARIDWHASADKIDRLVRAMNPSPGAFTTCNDHQIKIFDVEISQDDFTAPPGTVTEVGTHLVVSSGTGPLRILSLQLSGKKKITGEEFIHGFRNVPPSAFV